MRMLLHSTPQHFNYRVERLFPLFSENGLQTSHIILAGEAPGISHCYAGVVNSLSEMNNFESHIKYDCGSILSDSSVLMTI